MAWSEQTASVVGWSEPREATTTPLLTENGDQILTETGEVILIEELLIPVYTELTASVSSWSET